MFYAAVQFLNLSESKSEFGQIRLNLNIWEVLISYFISAFSYFLSPGVKEISIDFCIVQQLLTSISFVTKNNYDIEEQLADLFDYGARCKYLKEFEETKFKKNSYEDKLISIFEKKLFVRPQNAKAIKAKFYEKIIPFCVLPKT